jgi:FtsP/CotA-like multicopper oxidase with cupredoxin domain
MGGPPAQFVATENAFNARALAAPLPTRPAYMPDLHTLTEAQEASKQIFELEFQHAGLTIPLFPFPVCPSSITFLRSSSKVHSTLLQPPTGRSREFSGGYSEMTFLLNGEAFDGKVKVKAALDRVQEWHITVIHPLYTRYVMLCYVMLCYVMLCYFMTAHTHPL